jgi:outer membrane protein assembly factor BamB
MTGRERWAVDTGAAAWSPPVVADGVVYFGSRDGNLYALDAATGIECGRVALGGDVYTPVIANGFAYVGTFNGRVSALEVNGSP